MMEKDNDFYLSIYSLIKKKLDYRMDDGVKHDLRKFLNPIQDLQQQKEVSKSKILIFMVLIPLTSDKVGLADLHRIHLY